MLIKHHVSHVLDNLVGKDRSGYTFPLRMLVDAGVHIIDSSDAPIVYPDWRLGVQTAVLRESKATGEPSGLEQCITLKEAISTRTIEAAWQDHMDNVKGSIEVGKLADFCILGDDLLNIDPHQISKSKVLMTIVGGQIVHNAKPGFLYLK